LPTDTPANEPAAAAPVNRSFFHRLPESVPNQMPKLWNPAFAVYSATKVGMVVPGLVARLYFAALL
jgi:hypothetical protein